ncbi:hypothetical protein STAS_29791 [Striga asiatica]|uniref:Uncharacterized protein n=1 Tax=Striga asiatica TaxID=4170 RepID=A0A5A7R4I9_STRAF|nr:hypothetical protein STAS_29791 [Striga asiatica]
MLTVMKRKASFIMESITRSSIYKVVIVECYNKVDSKWAVILLTNTFQNQDSYEFDEFSDEEMEEEIEYYGPEPFMADIIREDDQKDQFQPSPIIEDLPQESLLDHSCEESSRYSTPAVDSGIEDEVVVEEILSGDSTDSGEYEDGPTSSSATNLRTNTSLDSNNYVTHEVFPDKQQPKTDIRFRQDECSMVFQQPMSRGKELLLPQDKKEEKEIFEDTFTLGSTSRDSSEWRSSMNDDPFSSSSRRSCTKWESCTLFQKYDEEMLFLDRITIQKLQEIEALRSIKAGPKSISKRIAHKLKWAAGRNWEGPYRELELAYVARICLTWETLGWSYKYFQRLRASRREFDSGCPAYVAQQFQQFQVLLQRYVETEPYEHGPRPEVCAQMRSRAPKLLQVPEYRDLDDDRREESQMGSRIPSRKAKVKEVCHSGKCFGGRRKLTEEAELEVVMALIDLKVVSRVLRMVDLSREQLRWCENKMSRIRVSAGKLHRDSSPLFFPAS